MNDLAVLVFISHQESLFINSDYLHLVTICSMSTYSYQ